MANTRQKFKEWKKGRLASANSDIAVFRGVPFWIWQTDAHEKAYKDTDGKCCFNHIVGLPEKEHLIGRGPPTPDNELGRPLLETRAHPIYDYQEEVIKSITNLEPTMVVKATGTGITTMTLRLMCWLCLKNDTYSNATMGIVTGPRLDIAKEELARIPVIFENMDYSPVIIGNQITINGCIITAYPSHTFDSARGLDKIRFFFVDEGDFFPIGQQVKARHVVERYIAKTHPMILLNSTPNLPGGMFDTIEKEGKSSIYTIHRLGYKVGMGKIYSEYEISEARKSPSFGREFDLQYGIGIGNIFNPKLIDRSTMDYDISHQGGIRILSVDPAFGQSETSSKFGIVGMERREDKKIYVVHAEQRARPSPEAMTEAVAQIYREGKYTLCQVDAAHSGIVRDWNNGSQKTGRKPINAMGIPFNENLDAMTTNAPLKINNDEVRIHYAFTDLIGQLKAVEYEEGKNKPDKKKLKFDVGDAFLMGLNYWNIEYGGRKLKGDF